MSAQSLWPEVEGSEVAEVLAVLRALSQKVSSPMIRVCLESAHDDIAHLAGTGAGQDPSEPEA